MTDISQQQLDRYNKAIALFMGCYFKEPSDFNIIYVEVPNDSHLYAICGHTFPMFSTNPINPKDSTVNIYRAREAKFNTSFDWLMPVWDKIRSHDLINVCEITQTEVRINALALEGPFVAFAQFKKHALIDAIFIVVGAYCVRWAKDNNIKL